MVGPRDQEDMAGEERTVVQKGKESLVFEDDGRRYSAGYNLTEQAGGAHLSIMPERGEAHGRSRAMIKAKPLLWEENQRWVR